jgi:hypothetical protein
MLRPVLRIPILLEINGAAVQIMVVEGAEKGLGEYIHINKAVHDAVDPMKFADAISGNAAPYHDAPIAMLHPFFDIYGIISLAWSPPAPVTPIRAKNIELRLIGENDCAPILL